MRANYEENQASGPLQGLLPVDKWRQLEKMSLQ